MVADLLILPGVEAHRDRAVGVWQPLFDAAGHVLDGRFVDEEVQPRPPGVIGGPVVVESEHLRSLADQGGGVRYPDGGATTSR